ncbi:response regulator [Niastella koreensis]|uniref:hypothetical protein n=1 Tax=Niastella koreensis TaxID=354356 RepID=UPI0010548EE5|nr:hypothetical protein [Niastella koreensis]
MIDDPENAEAMLNLSCLPREFNIVDVVYSVSELIKHPSLQTADVLLVDYFFPGELIKDFFSQFLTHNDTPVVFLSNFPQMLEDIIYPQYRKDTVSVFLKPFSFKDYEDICKQLHKVYAESEKLGQ